MNTTGDMVSSAFRFRHDADADAIYLQRRDGVVAETILVEEMVALDVDAEGQAPGIEFAVVSDGLAFLDRCGGEFAVPDRLDVRADAALSV